jgi:copper(I)-binding protein
MSNIKGLFILALGLLLASCSAPAPQIQLDGFWIVQPPSVARGTAGYGTIKNTGKEADTLLNVSSDIGFVMMHKTDLVNGMGRMIHMSKMVIAPASELVFEPMSYHLMFSKMADRIHQEGEKATLTFEFEKSGIISVEVPIKP